MTPPDTRPDLKGAAETCRDEAGIMKERSVAVADVPNPWSTTFMGWAVALDLGADALDLLASAPDPETLDRFLREIEGAEPVGDGYATYDPTCEWLRSVAAFLEGKEGA